MKLSRTARLQSVNINTFEGSASAEFSNEPVTRGEQPVSVIMPLTVTEASELVERRNARFRITAEVDDG